jgi:hypothetical protein
MLLKESGLKLPVFPLFFAAIDFGRELAYKKTTSMQSGFTLQRK